MTRGGGGLPSPAAAVIPVKCAVSTTPLGAGGGAAHATPSLPSPAAAVIAIAIVDVNCGRGIYHLIVDHFIHLSDIR